MSTKIRVTVSQVMAILALMGIVLSVIGTAWIGQNSAPVFAPVAVPAPMSGEIATTSPL